MSRTHNPPADYSLDRFVSLVLGFCYALRASKLAVGTSESIDAVQSLSHVDIANRNLFQQALKTTLVKRTEDQELFDSVFELFWSGLWRQLEPERESNSVERHASAEAGRPIEGGLPGSQAAAAHALSIGDMDQGGRRRFNGNITHSAYSPLDAAEGKRFRDFDSNQAVKVRRCLKKLDMKLATLEGRRRISGRAGDVDLRKTLRANIGNGGELTSLRRRTRKVARSKVVLLCDVSGSMDLDSDEVLMLMHAVSNTIRRADVFGFSTRLVPLNSYLRGRSAAEAAEEISSQVDIWSGGTKIGSALNALLSQREIALDKKTTVIVVSDGLDFGDVQLLDGCLRQLKRLVRRLIWVNPLADSPTYSPLALGMRTALPYIDALTGLSLFLDGRDLARLA